ncbi:MAG: helix-turn-helix transcriptional regulator [Euryarchaeota archaeon]|nr:helix-turn-helix transcriptional regulator [Euryarchaeota archaeon]
MAPGDPKKALEALASEHGLPILRFLQGRDWTLASGVAEGLGVHTSTASKYLAIFHDAGFLERRPHPAKRPTFAFRLRSPLIRLEFDLGERVESPDAADLAKAFAGSLLDAAHKVGGARLASNLAGTLFEGPDWRRALDRRFRFAPDARTAMHILLQDARKACGDVLGPAAAGRLVRIALEDASEGRQDVVEALGLQEDVA